MIRLNRLVARATGCSRREADAWIVDGRVSVDGALVDRPGSKFPEQSNIEVDQASNTQSLQSTVLYHKPLGIVSGQPSLKSRYPPAISCLTRTNFAHGRCPSIPPSLLSGFAPAGRLDVNSTGLLVLTQSGQVAREIIGPKSTMEKEYLVRIQGTPKDPLWTSQWLEGVADGEDLLRAASVDHLDEHLLRVVLTAGRNHHIRRLCRATGFETVALKRVRIGNVVLANLPLGKWRYLRPDETFV